MSDSPAYPDDPDEELKAADLLIRKADALLRKHKAPGPVEDDGGTVEDDIPILTDVVEDFVQSSTVAPDPQAHTAQRVELAELLVGLDTELAREIEAWFAKELPQLVTRELDRLAGRLQEETLAHMRATLIPVLAEHISRRLGNSRPNKP